MRTAGWIGGTIGLRLAAVAVAALLALTACVGGAGAGSDPVVIPPSGDGATTAPPSAGSPPSSPPPALAAAGDPEVLADGLAAPWSILRLPGGGVLVSERDTARIVEVLPDGDVREVVRVPGVAPGGEGGLLGLAFLAGEGGRAGSVYAYSHRGIRQPDRADAAHGRGPEASRSAIPSPVLTGIPRAGNHNGGRLAFGPDGFAVRDRRRRR